MPLRFAVTDTHLPPPLSPDNEAAAPRFLKITGLAAGKWTLKIDGKAITTADAKAWTTGVLLNQGPPFEQVEALRAAIIAKNREYFHRWRPQNETYLFGFRKHEQGQNAKEIPQFDPLVAEWEAKIAKLRVPATQQYEVDKAP
jgi:hypothetical protein